MKPERYYRDIPFWENRARLKLLKQFRTLVSVYFDNSVLNMISGTYNEGPEAAEAKEAITRIIKDVYAAMSSADIKTYTASISTVTMNGRGKNIDLILNIFNLGRNNVSPDAAVDYIDRAIAVYKSNRLTSLVRVVNPFFWISALVKHRRKVDASKKSKPSIYRETLNRTGDDQDAASHDPG